MIRMVAIAMGLGDQDGLHVEGGAEPDCDSKELRMASVPNRHS